MVVGYAYLAESHPQCLSQIRKHLQAFVELACSRGHRELYAHSSKIIEIFDGDGRPEAA